jgi:hypothetical protein
MAGSRAPPARLMPFPGDQIGRQHFGHQWKADWLRMRSGSFARVTQRVARTGALGAPTACPEARGSARTAAHHCRAVDRRGSMARRRCSVPATAPPSAQRSSSTRNLTQAETLRQMPEGRIGVDSGAGVATLGGGASQRFRARDRRVSGVEARFELAISPAAWGAERSLRWRVRRAPAATRSLWAARAR